MIDDLDTPRSAPEIARRVIALQCVVAAAHGVSKADITWWLREESLWDELTPRELRFLEGDEHPPPEIFRMQWFAETQVALLWAIGKLDELPPLTDLHPPGLVIDAIPGLGESTAPFIESASLRSTEELEAAEEYIYDVHCRVNGARRKNEAMPEGYNRDAVFFRHYGLSWVVGYCGQAWDEVTPDI